MALLLAICFLMLGTGVMHGKGLAFEESAGGFAAQIIALYTQTLGEWSRPLIGIFRVGSCLFYRHSCN